MDLSQDQIEEVFSRQVRLCSGIGRDKMVAIVNRHEFALEQGPPPPGADSLAISYRLVADALRAAGAPGDVFSALEGIYRASGGAKGQDGATANKSRRVTGGK